MDIDLTKAKTIVEYRLARYDGEHVPGDGMKPCEFLVGGDDREQKLVQPGDAEYEALCAKEAAGEAQNNR